MDLLSTIRKTGSRGGVNFSWDEVANSSRRENYLGHSLKAPVGRWQMGKDLNWYAKPDDAVGDVDGDETNDERQERERRELRKVKEAEEDAMARALGLPVQRRDATTGANAVELEAAKRKIGPSAAAGLASPDEGHGATAAGEGGRFEEGAGGASPARRRRIRRDPSRRHRERGRDGRDHERLDRERPDRERPDRERHYRHQRRSRSRSRGRDGNDVGGTRRRWRSRSHDRAHRDRRQQRSRDRNDGGHGRDERRHRRAPSRSRSRERESHGRGIDRHRHRSYFIEGRRHDDRERSPRR